MSKEEQSIRFDDYGKQIREGLLKSHEHFDKTLSLISSGGLVLSMAFIEKMGGTNPLFPISLVAAWVFLGLTLLLSLTSSLRSIYNHKKVEKSYDQVMDMFHQIDWNNIDQRMQFEENYQKHIKLVEGTNRGTDFLTWVPYITLLCGTTCLILFTSVNILTPVDNGKATTKTSNKPEQSSATGHKGNPTSQAAKDTTISATKP